MTTVGKQLPELEGNILFLFRTYNDIDHIAPVIWKVAKSGHKPFFAFVDKNYSEDYRIKVAIEAGAVLIRCAVIELYHQRIRRWLGPRWIRRVVDRLIAHSYGYKFLVRHKIAVLVSEWSGALGREMAEYYLRPASAMGLSCISLPHGYYIWTNDIINAHEITLWEKSRTRPDFTDRNSFSTYVVQNSEAKQFKIKRGMSVEKVRVLGSARFCQEWFDVNCGLTIDHSVELTKDEVLRVLFFVPDWNYNIDRQACVRLLECLASLDNILLTIKANTRGTGSLTQLEQHHLNLRSNVKLADIRKHSPYLIRESDVVINFASSIGLEALLHNKPVCNPTYLNGNNTIFDGSGVVFDAKNVSDVLSFIYAVRDGRYELMDPDTWATFRKRYILGDSENEDVLSDYLRILAPHSK